MKGIPEDEGTVAHVSEDQSSQQSVSIIAINYQTYTCTSVIAMISIAGHSHQCIYYILCHTGCEQYDHYGYDLKSYGGYRYGLHYHSGYTSRR